MNVEGIGSETIAQLFDLGYIKSPSDLYRLSFEQLSSMERFGEKSARNLLDGLEKSKSMPFKNVLFALGIRYVGQTVAEKLADFFKNIDQLKSADIEQLQQAPEIGEKIAQSIVEFFKQAENLALVEALQHIGLKFEQEIIVKNIESELLKDKTFVVSGTFKFFERDELKHKIESNGGKVLSGVSAKLNYLIAGENMGPSKLEKATKLGVQIIDENQFLAMLGITQ
jgi:DNA ligase (NAD+)